MSDILFHFSAKLSLIFRSILAIYFSEEFCIYGARLHLSFGAFLLVFRNIFSEAVCISLDLFIYHLVGDVNDIFWQFVLAVEFSIELRSYSDVESKSEGVLIVQIHLRSQFFIWQRVTKYIQFLSLDILT